MVKVGILEVCPGVDFLISGSDSDSESCSRFVGSFMTCVQNMRSIRRDLIGFGVVYRIWNFQSSLGLNPCLILVFDVV